MDNFELTAQAEQALNIMENTYDNLLLTGKAGTGKSTLLKYFRDRKKKNIVILAPTGVAAVTVEGQTIHSFGGFSPKTSLSTIFRREQAQKLCENIDTIVIDEISMVRADLLDFLDKFLRVNTKNNLPFGGIQMIFIGDLYQLPPVLNKEDRPIFYKAYKSEYFFDSNVTRNTASSLYPFKMKMIEFNKVYRQSDNDFIEILNAVRTNSITPEHIDKINERLNPNFKPDPKKFYVYLTAKKDKAEEKNQKMLNELQTPRKTYSGEIEGHFPKDLPTEKELVLKEKAQVMFVKNDKEENRWVNGTMGEIVSLKEDLIEVLLQTGEVVEVKPVKFSNTKSVLKTTISKKTDNEKEKLVHEIEKEEIGSFTQFPLRLAKAITIHKSQSKTFKNVIIDVGDGTFAPGQLYVALSRCETLDGIVLNTSIHPRHIFVDPRIVQFMKGIQ